MRRPKEESRILYALTCNNSVIFVVYRSYFMEDFSFICSTDVDYFSLINEISCLKTFEEIRYFITDSVVLGQILGSLGIYSISKSLSQELLLRHSQSLKRICSFVDNVCMHKRYGIIENCLEIIK